MKKVRLIFGCVVIGALAACSAKNTPRVNGAPADQQTNTPQVNQSKVAQKVTPLRRLKPLRKFMKRSTLWNPLPYEARTISIRDFSSSPL